MSSTETFDVIVIGGGIAGAGLAAELAPNHRVALIEREGQVGMHATGRSAALFSATYGGGLVRALSRASREFFISPPSDFADGPLLRERGTLHVATAAQRERLEAFAELPDISPLTRRLTADQALSLCPILRPDYVAAGLFEAGSSDIEVNLLHQGYLRRLRAHDGLIVTDAQLQSIERDRGMWRAHVPGRCFSAPILANAAGAWVDEVAALAGVAPLGIQPKRRTAILVDPPAGADVSSWPLTIDIDEEFYFKPDAGLLLLSPADETDSAPCDAYPDDMDIAIAVDRVETATTMQVRRVRHRWAGLRSFFPDRMPVAGFDPKAEQFFWLAGQGGYGIQTAPALNRAAAKLLSGGGLPEDLAELGVTAQALAPARLLGPEG